MNITLPRNIVTAASAAALGIGAILLAWGYTAEGKQPAASLVSRPLAAMIPKMPSRTFTSNFEAIVTRPLFTETRKPVAPKLTAAPAPQEATIVQPLSATLAGVIVSPNIRSAIVRLAGGNSIAVAEGETVQGWQLKRVTPDSAQFEQRNAKAELTFPTRQVASGSAAMPGAPARRRP